MIPVTDARIKLVDIENEKYADYLKSEIIYLSNKSVVKEIVLKSRNIFEVLQNNRHHDYDFFNKLCCNFNKLEEVYLEYK